MNIKKLWLKNYLLILFLLIIIKFILDNTYFVKSLKIEDFDHNKDLYETIVSHMKNNSIRLIRSSNYGFSNYYIYKNDYKLHKCNFKDKKCFINNRYYESLFKWAYLEYVQSIPEWYIFFYKRRWFWNEMGFFYSVNTSIDDVKLKSWRIIQKINDNWGIYEDNSRR